MLRQAGYFKVNSRSQRRSRGHSRPFTTSTAACQLAPFEPDEAAGQSDFQGKTYYLCCNECKAKFDQNPQASVKSAPERGCTLLRVRGPGLRLRRARPRRHLRPGYASWGMALHFSPIISFELIGVQVPGRPLSQRRSYPRQLELVVRPALLMARSPASCGHRS